MRVLHITDDMAGFSGIRSYLDGLSQEAARTGLELDVFAPPGDLRQISSLASRWYSGHWRRAVARRIASFNPRVVHAHSVSMRLSPAPLAAARRVGVPVAMTVHDYGLVCPRKWMVDDRDRPCERGFGAACLVHDCRSTREGRAWIAYQHLRWLKVALHRFLLRRWVDLFVCPSEHLATWMRHSLHLAPERVVALPNFAPPITEAPAPLPERPRLLFAGRLSREKGVDVLLRALPRVAEAHPEVELVIVGDGPERTALTELAGHLGVAARVRFAGRLTGGELERAYRRATLCVLPTLWMENCPVSVLEAFAHGRPVVATRIGGVPELVVNGRTGLLFERGEEDLLAEQLVDVLADRRVLFRMAKFAWGVAQRDFSRSQHFRNLQQLYTSL